MKKAALILLVIAVPLAIPQVVLATQAQLACSPTTSTVNVGDTITTDIILNSRSYQITGADAIFTYTTGVLDANSKSLTPVLTYTNWTAPTTQNVDSTLGKVELDYGSSQRAFTSSGSIGQIAFTAKQAGVANINFVFFQEYDDTTSGVAKAWGERVTGTKSNVLTDVVNCSYTVNGASDTPVPTSPASPAAPTRSVLPRTGTADVTAVLAGGAVLLAVIGLGLQKILLRRS